jgi:putative acetyltransferase
VKLLARIDIAFEPPDAEGVGALLEDSDAYLLGRYPKDHCHLLHGVELAKPNVHFVVARHGGRAIGCGAIVVRTEECELKRIFVEARARGAGIGQRIVETLERLSGELNAAAIRLETGTEQPEALALYGRLGYRECGAFAQYQLSPHSIFLEKILRPRHAE